PPLAFFLQAEGGIRDFHVTGVQTCALPISRSPSCPGGQFSPGQLGDLVVGSGGGSYSTANAILEINTSVPESWTLQFAVKAVSLPNDFSSLVSNHVFVGTTDGAGACAGVFISKVGVVYTGGVSHSVSGDLQIDGP